MSQTAEARQLAAFLRMFKNRADRSYEALARRTGVSSSTLHRYCAGSSVPNDYGTVQRFASTCGASHAELRDLHRLWALADAGRREHPVPPPERAPLPRRRLLVAAAALVLGAAGMSWAGRPRRLRAARAGGPARRRH